MLPIDTILALDCAIVDRSNILWLDSDPEESQGVTKELEKAEEEGIEIVLIYDLDDEELNDFCLQLHNTLYKL